MDTRLLLAILLYYHTNTWWEQRRPWIKPIGDIFSEHQILVKFTRRHVAVRGRIPIRNFFFSARETWVCLSKQLNSVFFYFLVLVNRCSSWSEVSGNCAKRNPWKYSWKRNQHLLTEWNIPQVFVQPGPDCGLVQQSPRNASWCWVSSGGRTIAGNRWSTAAGWDNFELEQWRCDKSLECNNNVNFVCQVLILTMTKLPRPCGGCVRTISIESLKWSEIAVVCISDVNTLWGSQCSIRNINTNDPLSNFNFHFVPLWHNPLLPQIYKPVLLFHVIFFSNKQVRGNTLRRRETWYMTWRNVYKLPRTMWRVWVS